MFDTLSADDSVVTVSEEEQRSRAIGRYETIIATLVGALALCVSGYTAYVQRQQVRATVWPILEFDSSNSPEIHFTLANKGVGPALIRKVVVKVDGQPVRNWHEVLQKILGPGEHWFSESNINGHVFSAGESINVLTPHDAQNNPVVFNKSDPLWVKLDRDRGRVTVEICYCSTLGDCWTLHAGGLTSGATSDGCSLSSQLTFKQ